MVTQEQFKQHYENLYNSKAVYVWGANGEIITKELIDKLYRSYGSATYTREYYNNKLKEGQGRIGADCSGSIYPLSKADNTAKGYYNLCKVRGKIADIPSNTACLVFNSSFTHVGAYLGNGVTVEMANSRDNCVRQAFQKSRWTYYGIPAWLETVTSSAPKPAITVTKPIASEKNEVISNLQKWINDNQYINIKIVVDGNFGPKTKQALCMVLQDTLNRYFNANIAVDGSFGPKTKAVCVSASRHKDLTIICQAMLYVKGYDMKHSIVKNFFDGGYGANTKKTVKTYQMNTKGLRYDGDCGPATFYAMFNQ